MNENDRATTKKVPVAERVCEFCSEQISDKTSKVVKSFLLTDSGPICFECWDSKVSDYEHYEIFKLFAKPQVIEDNWEARAIWVVSYDLGSEVNRKRVRRQRMLGGLE